MTDGSTPPPSPYDPGAPVRPPAAAHQVVVTPALRNVLTQTIVGVLLLVVGFGLAVVGIVRPPEEDRVLVLVVGGVLSLLGLFICLTLRRVLRSRTYTFTHAGFEGQDAAGRGFRLLWSDLESVTVEAWERRSVWHDLMMRRFRPVNGYLLITVRPGAQLTGNVARWAKVKRVRLPFWNRYELVDSFAYGFRTYAGPRFHGVVLR